MSHEVIVEQHGPVGMLKLNHGTTNSLGPNLIVQLTENVRQLRESPDIEALVLTSENDKFFSIGFNIPALIDLPRSELLAFYQSFNRVCLDLFSFPGPTIAALSGHAIAGGCVLALCCDQRWIAEGRKLMGLNEIKLALPVPYVVDCILHSTTNADHAREITLGGEFYSGEDLLRLGLVERMVPLEQLRAQAISQAARLSATMGDPALKRERIAPVLDQIHAALQEREENFANQWFTDEAQALLKEAMASF